MKLCRKCRLEIFLVLKDRVNIRRHVSDIQPFKYEVLEGLRCCRVGDTSDYANSKNMQTVKKALVEHM